MIANQKVSANEKILWVFVPLTLFFCLSIAFFWVKTLFGLLPLSYDEIANFVFLSIQGPHYVMTHYPFPNNHVFFTLLQSLLPNTWVLAFPSILRLINLGCSLFFGWSVFYLIHSFFKNKMLSLFLAMGFYFLSVFHFGYFVLARGYLIGLLLCLWASFLIAKQVEKASCSLLGVMAAILAGYTVPTFAVMVGCVLAVLGLQYPSLKAWKILMSSAFACALGWVLFYFPIYRDVLSNKTHAWNGHLGLGEYSLKVMQEVSQAPVGCVCFALVGVLVLGKKRHFGWTLLASCVLYLLTLEIFSFFGWIPSLFTRNAHFVVSFTWLGLALLMLGTWSSSIFLTAFSLNAVTGVLFSMSALLGRPLQKSIELLEYSPSRAFTESLNELKSLHVTSIECESFADPVCQLAAKQLGVSYQLNMSIPRQACLVGSQLLPDPQSFIQIKTDQTQGLLCLSFQAGETQFF